MQFVFDFHIHAVPEIDDGARSMEEALEILKIAASCGVTDAFCTSHSINFDKGGKNYKEAFEKLCHAVEREGLPVKLHKGCEVRCLFRNMESILRGVDDGWFDTLGDTKYVLIELYPHTQINEALQIVKMFTERGYIPVIAHMERNYNLPVSSVRLLISEGALVQVNSYSFVDEDEEEMQKARILLENKLIHFIGSDAHRIDERLPAFDDGIRYIKENADEDYVNALLYDNAKMIIEKKY